MAKILTPVTLWRDFDETLPLEEEIVAERQEGGIVSRDVFFLGRETGKGRVKIYARYLYPAGEETFPAILMLFEAGLPFDETFARNYVKDGYGVLLVDYCGEKPEGFGTVYPPNVDYANFSRAGRHATHCDGTAKETSWYEWAAVARYAVRYLNERPEITRVGAIGLRTGGEVLFKVAPFCRLSCMISVCAAGWLAYRGIDKFGAETEQRDFDLERHRFIAGLDSQSYAPFITCPVLLLSAINDKSYNYDRVYDTFSQLNPNIEKALLFSAHGNGLLGRHTLSDISLFFAKHLKGRSVFISKPLSISTGEEDGNLVIRGEFDPEGEINEFGVFYTENIAAFKTRDWTRVYGKKEDLDGNIGTIPLSLFAGRKKALIYVFANYSNNFSTTSKILEFSVDQDYKNACPKSRVIYTGEDGRNGFSSFRRRTRSMADCFIDNPDDVLRTLPGYGGIHGIAVSSGIISYRVGEPRFRPPEGASFRFDAYAFKDTHLNVVFFKDEEEAVAFRAVIPVAGGGKWKNVLLDAYDFKSESGAPLGSFEDVVSVAFMSGDEVLINNVLWI